MSDQYNMYVTVVVHTVASYHKTFRRNLHLDIDVTKLIASLFHMNRKTKMTADKITNMN